MSLEKLYTDLITFLQNFEYTWADGYDCSVSSAQLAFLFSASDA